MSRQIDMPDELYDRVTQLANQQQVAVSDFVASAIVDQLATRAWIARRAVRSNERDFLWALDQTPDVPPAENDR